MTLRRTHDMETHQLKMHNRLRVIEKQLNQQTPERTSS